MRRATIGAVLGAAGLLALATAGRADEAAIPLDRLPRAVAEAARTRFPGATWREAARETEGGKTVYEVAMTHEGRKLDATFAPDGTLVVVEAVIPESELPAAAARAVRTRYPGARVGLVESITKGPETKKDADAYELHITTADKKKVEIVVDRRGKILEVEDGEGDDEE